MNDLRTAAQQALEAWDSGAGPLREAEVFEALRAALAQEQAEPDLSRCPQCNGPADNGHDRSIPPNPYLCTRCMAEPAQEHEDWCASVTELLLSCPPRKAPCNCKPAQSPSTPKEKEMTDSNSVFFSLNTGAFPVEMLRLDGSGFHYKGKVIEDAGEAYNLFKQWLAMAHQQAEPVQEPVAWECKAGGLKPLTQRQYDAQPDNIKRHYTRIAPPRRELVPLTEEEILAAVGWERAEMYMKLTPNFPVDEAKKETLKNARAIEKASWEKNNGKA